MYDFMAFSDFKSIFDVESSYQTVLLKDDVFIDTPSLALTESFMKDLRYSVATKKPNPSEIALCESFIFPMIRFVAQEHEHIAVWSREFDLAVDAKLVGTPDYLFSYTESRNRISRTMPLICVSEAKVDNFTTAWGQTLAEMVACQKLYPTMVIYGFASNGESWQFGKLENNVFVQDINTYNIANQAEKIAGLLNHIFIEAVGEAERYLGKR
jgi:hypothetical protein